jgi:hypothetical protein
MSKYDNIDIEKINAIKLHVEDSSVQMDEIVNSIINIYVQDLDEYVTIIDNRLCEKDNPPTDEELDTFCLNLSTLIYFAGGMCEQLGLRSSIATAVYKETYNTNRDTLTKGTVQDKNALAELSSQQEQLVDIAYKSAYKIVKSKVENAQEVLASCKKVISRRVEEMRLTNLTGGN